MKPVSIAPAYVAFYPILTDIARKHGYSLSVHGSVQSDMDLIAVPWVLNARPVEQLVEALKDYVSKTMSMMFKDPVTIHGPERKPYRRVAYSIQIGNGHRIDLSIIDTVNVKAPLPDFESLTETDKQKLAIMLTKGTEAQREEAISIIMVNLTQ